MLSVKQDGINYHLGGARGVMVIGRRKWTRRHEFKSWTRLISFLIALITLWKGMTPIILPPAMSK